MTQEELKARIKQLAAEGCVLRNRILQTHGPERHALWNEKRTVGRRARAALLAYAYMRGVPRSRLEPVRSVGNDLHPCTIIGMWRADLGVDVVPAPDPRFSGGLIASVLRMLRPPAVVRETIWTRQRVERWLTTRAEPSRERAAVR
jgi:hypothetical protein